MSVYLTLRLADEHETRFADRDMVIRYHWGIGVGHTYSHRARHDTHAQSSPCSQDDAAEDQSLDTPNAIDNTGGENSELEGESPSVGEPPELLLEARDDDDWHNSDNDSDSELETGNGGRNVNCLDDSEDDILDEFFAPNDL